jgi:predicted ATPase
MKEAVAQLQKGLDLLKSMPDTSARQQQELDLRMTLGIALIATKGWATPLVGETYARAHLLAGQLDRPDYLFALLRGQVLFHHLRGEYKLALSLAQQMEEIGQTRGDAVLVHVGRSMHGMIRCVAGEFVAARAILEQNYGMSDSAARAAIRDALAMADETAYNAGLRYLAVSLGYLGYVDAARYRAREVLSEASQLGHAFSLAQASVFACWTEYAVGSPYDVGPHAEQLTSLAREHGFSFQLATGLIYRGWSMSALGELEEGYGMIAKGLALHRTTESVAYQTMPLILLAEACSKLGRTTEGLNYLTEADQIIETTNERFHEVELHRVRGDLFQIMGNLAGAELSYQHAIAIAKRQCAKMFELRVSTKLARLWRDKGKRDEARELLAPLYGWFTEGFDTHHLNEAKALLDELAA